MRNSRVFIGWSGPDNQEIARKVSNRLSESGFSSIIGGEWKASLTVSEEIIDQMNVCDFAIVLIEKEIRRNKQDEIVSMGFNPNVMMELGYMLRKVSDHQRIRRVLLNLDPSELPSDLQGAWTLKVEKPDYEKDDAEARERVLNSVTEKIVDDFLGYIKNFKNADKLDYFDDWEENKLDIYNYKGDIRIADKLIYGMQAAVYSGEFERLYEKLTHIKAQLAKKDRYGDYSAVACAMAVLNVFVATNRLTKPLEENDFYSLCDALSREYENNMDDDDLKCWCKIFRTDKLELCYELFAGNQSDNEEKIEYYYAALELCHNIFDMIEAHINDVPEGQPKKDEEYSLLYKAFTTRNIYLIHGQLKELEPDKAEEHLAKQKQYCAETYGYRKELYSYYTADTRENSLSMNFVSQEYLLSIAEQYKFEDSRLKKMELSRTAKNLFGNWRKRIEIQNMIFAKVEKEGAGFLF